MSFVDYLLDSAEKLLKKAQKARRDHKKRRKQNSQKKSLKAKKETKSPTKKKTTALKKKKEILKKSPKKATKKAPPKKKKVPVKKKSSIPKKTKNVNSSVEKKKKGVLVGEITHYFSRISVVVIKITKGTLAVGDQIQVIGRNIDFEQKIQSMQIESVDVKKAKKGQLVGLKINKKANEGDKVYKV